MLPSGRSRTATVLAFTAVPHDHQADGSGAHKGRKAGASGAETCAVALRMHRSLLEQHLAQAEQHVREGERHVSDQRDVVARLANRGHDTRAARELLAQFESLLATHIAGRDRLKAELVGTPHP